MWPPSIMSSSLSEPLDSPPQSVHGACVFEPERGGGG